MAKREQIPTGVNSIVIEMIQNGFIIKYPVLVGDSTRVYRATLNGVFDVVSTSFQKPIIKLDKSEKTDVYSDCVVKRKEK